MDREVFLLENRSEFSNNVESSINIELSTKTRLLPNDNASDTFSLFEQYNRERDECDRYRFIFAVNPICSNVLYNMKTEIIINEGTDDCNVILDKNNGGVSKNTFAPNAVNTESTITYRQALMDTEYSHKLIGYNGIFEYHCGIDIFNNHMLRKIGFVHVNPISQSETGNSGRVYNTIKDFLRDGRGDVISSDISVDNSNRTRTNMHLYEYDTIQSMLQAFGEKCTEKDGWWGFTNPGNIEIKNNTGETITINRMMASKKACEFIDLYPDRSLYSFVPKYNTYRRRIEKNWDYCTTYPYFNDIEKLNEICGGEQGAVRASIKYKRDTSSTPLLECSCYFKHNLQVGDYVNFYYYMGHYRKVDVNNIYSPLDLTCVGDTVYVTSTLDSKGLPTENSTIVKTVESKEFQRYNAKVKVVSVGDAQGDHTDRVFSVRYSDIQSIFEYLKFFGCFYKRIVNGSESQYYLRKFKKIKRADGNELSSDINKAAFANNIYGDEIAQVIFTDDIDLKGLTDNNGRPVSEVYFTVIKRNAGHREWYEKEDFKNKNVEYSHCFGVLTSGIDFSGIEDEPFDYNAHFLHNLSGTVSSIHNNVNFKTGSMKEIANTLSAWGETILSGTPKTIESDITIDMDEFYGDVAEYNISNAEENIIGYVYHRFNSAQRETWNYAYMSQYQDVITSDDYDSVNGKKDPFNVTTYYLNDIENSKSEVNSSKRNLMYGNIFPEGYMYNPHIPIQVKEFSDEVSSSSAKYVNYTNPILSRNILYILTKQNGEVFQYDSQMDALSARENGDTLQESLISYQLTFTVPVNYGFYKGDFIAFYNTGTTEIIWGEITSVSGLDLTVKMDAEDFSVYSNVNVNLFKPASAYRVFYAFWATDNIPLYAKYSSGEQKFKWRRIIPPSEMTDDNVLFDTPFANGRFYMGRTLTFFLKRQDPNGDYGLSRPMFKVYNQDVANPMQRFSINGNEPMDLSGVIYFVGNALSNCY